MEHPITKEYLSFIKKFMRPLWYWVSIIITMTLVYSFLTCFFSYAIKLIVDVLESSDGGSILGNITVPAIAFVMTFVLMSVVLRIRMYAASIFYPTLQQNVNRHVHSILQHQVFGQFKEQMTGGIVNRAIEFNRTFAAMLELLTTGLFAVSQVCIYVIFLYFSSKWFTFVYLLWLFIFIPITVRYSLRANRLARHYADSVSAMMGQMMDSINNLYFVKLFAHQGYESHRIEGVSSDTYGRAVDFRSYLIKLQWMMNGFVLIILIVNLCLLLYLYQYGKVTTGDFVFVLTSIVEMTWYICDFCGEKLPVLIEEYGKGFQAFQLFNFCERQSTEDGTQVMEVKKGEVHFDNINYGYLTSHKLFNHFSLTVKPGEKVGLVGYSGSGKTTLMHLLLGFYHVNSGSIKIDGQSVADVTRGSLRRYIGMIPQDTALFHRSLKENIRYGNLEADDDMVIEACKKAHAHDFIQQLPDGYETMVGERGLKLSGGQRQRIAIARAFLKNAPILLLDEATSALDTVTEQAIYKSLQKLMVGRTTIVIAHRLSTIKSMDRILVMDQGEVVEEGSHEQLLKLNGHYARMWLQQDNSDILT